MNPVAEDILQHYGMPRRSGRYPWGSGEDPYQRTGDFLARIDELKKSGWKETPENIMKEFGLTTTQYRAQRGLARDEQRMYKYATAKSLKDDGLGPSEIGRKMGMSESSVRSLLNEESAKKMTQAKNTADFIREQINTKGMVDVGKGVERELNISKEKLDQALAILESEGYPIYNGRFQQTTNQGQWTTQKVICPPGTPHKDIYKLDEVHTLNDYISRDDGQSYEKKFNYPASMDSKRLMVRYNEDGGLQKDGIVELRRGVEDLSLGNSRYSQVRILVDGTHYIKGMAVYSDDMPNGVDVIFNTNKTKGTPMTKVLKEIKSDPDNPFGSAIKDAEKGGQYWYTDSKTGERKLGLINKRADEGDWTEWKDALPSQFLSKQSKYMAKKQLDLAIADKMDEYETYKSLTNPTVKKYFLNKFADECDSAAVHLQAAALPGQKYHVIVPINSLTEKEVFAPNYENGTKLALIRYPHGGTFEIPILTVNNKNKLARDVLGTDVIDAVGINSKVAERLSGADFDGDTVMCIPTHDRAGKVKITSTDKLKGLEGFDPKTEYQYAKMTKDPDGTKHYFDSTGREFKAMKNTGTQMGIISNLITDMTLLGASSDELARAVRHSMVVIDAEKHGLDYKRSEMENGIAALHKAYQGRIDPVTGKEHNKGASTIISRAKGQQSVVKRQGNPLVNQKGKEWYDPTKPEGSLIYKKADDADYSYEKVNKKTGEITTVHKTRMQQSTKMAETDDAYTLVSGNKHPMEIIYADFANKMKSLANESRMEVVNTGKIAYSASAKNTYQKEVNDLMDKLNTALLNAPREREAQRRANAEVQAKQAADPSMKPSDVKKAKQQALTKYRQEVDAVARSKRAIKITDREWEAIQAGAISENNLKKILDNTDVDSLRERATPRTSTTLNQAKINRIKSMSASNFTLNEIANKLGVSTTTVAKYMKGVN